jgi:hypothetical protein
MKEGNIPDSVSWAMSDMCRLLGWLVQRRWNKFKFALCELCTQLEGVPASVLLTVLLIMHAQASLSVLPSTHS